MEPHGRQAAASSQEGRTQRTNARPLGQVLRLVFWQQGGLGRRGRGGGGGNVRFEDRLVGVVVSVASG